MTTHSNRFFVFADQLDPMTAHNLTVTGQFTSTVYALDEPKREAYFSGSLDLLLLIPNPNSAGFISPFAATAANDWRVEYDAEIVRCERFQDIPSRLAATFAFADHASCQQVASTYGWDLKEVVEFELVPDTLTRVSRVNMEVVSLARLAYRWSSIDEETDNALWDHYWSGGGDFQLEIPVGFANREVRSSGVIWEFLIDGRLRAL